VTNFLPHLLVHLSSLTSQISLITVLHFTFVHKSFEHSMREFFNKETLMGYKNEVKQDLKIMSFTKNDNENKSFCKSYSISS